MMTPVFGRCAYEREGGREAGRQGGREAGRQGGRESVCPVRGGGRWVGGQTD